MKKYFDMRTGRTIKVIKRVESVVTVIIDGKVSHLSIDYLMDNCKEIGA